MIERYLDSLVEYAVRTGLAQEADRRVLTNRLLDILRLDDYPQPGAADGGAGADPVRDSGLCL